MQIKINVDKAYFQYDKAYGDFKDQHRRIISDKVLCVKRFNITKDPKCDGQKCKIASLVYNSFDKKCPGGAVTGAI